MGRNCARGDWMHFNREELKGVSCYYPIILIAIISFILRVNLRSNYLDDWDSIQFALAIDDYSIAAHQPHPPGYPVYIFLARLIHLVIPNVTDSLIYLSILFGVLSIIAIYLLGKTFFGEIVGVMSALMLSFTPAHLEFSDVAMSDIVSLFFIIITIYLLYNSTSSREYLYLGSISLGITIGIRQTDILLIPLYLIFLVARRNDLRSCILSIVLFSISVCAWLLPTILDTGLNTFIEIQRNQGSWAVNASTLNLLGGLSFGNLSETFRQFMILLISGWSISLLVFLAIIVVYFVYNRQKILRSCMDGRMLILACWILAYFSFSIFCYQLYIVRYLLPIFPALAIVISYGSVKLIQSPPKMLSRSLLVAIIIACLIFMVSQSIANGYLLHISKPAPVLASDYIQEHFLPDEVAIIASDSFRHFQYYLPGYQILVWGDVPQYISQGILYGKTILADQDPTLFGNITYKKMEFIRDPSIYSKHMSVRLYQFKYGNETCAIFPLNGFHGAENWSGTATRWMYADANIQISSQEDRATNLSMKALSFYRNRTLEISSDGVPVNQFVVPMCFINVVVPIRLSKGENMVRLHVPEGCEKPCDKPELNNPDSRCFSVAVQNLTVT